MTATRTVTWGDALIVETFKTPGGLRAVVRAIHAEVGNHIGSRNTFSKFYRVDDPAQLSATDQYRAWLLIAGFGLDPADWGLSNNVVPPAVDVDRLRAALCARRDSNPKPSDSDFCPFCAGDIADAVHSVICAEVGDAAGPAYVNMVVSDVMAAIGGR